MNSIIAEKKFISERTGIPYSNLSQAYLRAETLLGTLSSYSFELQKNNVASPNVTERLLNLNDEFVISHMTIALKTVADTETDQDHLISTLSNYGVTEDGTITNGEAIYNSSLSMIIDRKEFLPNYDVRFFRRVPDQQSGLNATGGATNQNAVTNGLFGFAPFEPVKIDGRQTINTTVDLGASCTITAPASHVAYACLIVRGYLVVNAKS
jgi:hypothetical protein